jgi:hypothetical protein
VSLACNNLADVSLLEARWQLENKHPKEAQKCIQDAKINLRRSLAQVDAQPIGHVTMAEAACLELAFSTKPLTSREQTVQEVLGRLQLAIDLGFLRFKNLDQSELASKYPNLGECSKIDPTFFSKLAQL